MHIIDIIEKKKRNQELSLEEINYVIDGYMSEEIKDYQMSSLLMAICFNSMTDEETINLTIAMVKSGETIDLSNVARKTVDKHSTGGVGDKTSLIVGPVLASFDLAVAKMSGRGLGHTGGTVDKLEAISGFDVSLTEEEFLNQVNEVGVAIVGQTKNLVPADKKIYALRDVTATVDSIPLIASSIMSKKLASGADVIVLDVKYGSGAFMKTKEEAIKLSEKLVMIGNGANRKTIACVTSMEQPLGNAVGNANEIMEVIDTLQNEGPQDLTDVCVALCQEALLAYDLASDYEEAKKLIIEKLENKEALNKFYDFIYAQKATKNSIENLKLGNKIVEIVALEAGYVERISADLIGKAAMYLGAGRENIDSIIDYEVGIDVNKKIGDYVQKEDVIATLFVNEEKNLEEVVSLVEKAFVLTQSEVKNDKIIEKIVK